MWTGGGALRSSRWLHSWSKITGSDTSDTSFLSFFFFLTKVEYCLSVCVYIYSEHNIIQEKYHWKWLLEKLRRNSYAWGWTNFPHVVMAVVLKPHPEAVIWICWATIAADLSFSKAYWGLRSCYPQQASARLIPEAKQGEACLVVGWETTQENQVL